MSFVSKARTVLACPPLPSPPSSSRARALALARTERTVLRVCHKEDIGVEQGATGRGRGGRKGWRTAHAEGTRMEQRRSTPSPRPTRVALRARRGTRTAKGATEGWKKGRQGAEGEAGRGGGRRRRGERASKQRRSTPSPRRLAPAPLAWRCEAARYENSKGGPRRGGKRGDRARKGRQEGVEDGAGGGNAHQNSGAAPHRPAASPPPHLRGDARPARYDEQHFSAWRRNSQEGIMVLPLCPVQMSFLSRNLIAQSTAAVAHPNTRTARGRVLEGSAATDI